jgi:WD40 repeat-containing protein SMU1
VFPKENLIAMDNSVISLAFSKDSELLASGSTDGVIAVSFTKFGDAMSIRANRLLEFAQVWRVTTGQCQRRFSPAHSQGVTSIAFNKDGTQVLSSSFDHSIKIHGLKSGKILKEFRGHTSFVNNITFSADMARVISASSDGTVKVS